MAGTAVTLDDCVRRPVLELAGDYRNWFETAGKLADTLSQSGRSSLFHGTAVRFYGIEM